MKNVAKLGLINGLGIVLAILVVEGVFGEWFYGSFRNLNIPRETIYFDASGLYRGGDSVKYVRDRNGLRGRYSHPSDIDILTIGGSTTDQRTLTEGQTWQDILSAAFAADGKSVSVVNAGVDGQSTMGNLHNFDAWFPLIPDLRAQFILVYTGINDVHVWMKETADKNLAESPVLRVHHTIKNNSALYRLYRTIKGALIARKARLSGDVVNYALASWTDRPGRPVDPQFEDKVLGYRDRLEKLVARIRAFGAKPILVTQRRGDYRYDSEGKLWGIVTPHGEANGVDEALALRRMNETTLAVCARLKVRCIDLASELHLDQSDFYDRVHTNPQGARKIGLYLYRKLKNLSFSAR